MQSDNYKLDKRNSSIELLRMLAGMAVVILHFNFSPDGGGALESATGITYYILMFLEVISVCAVNVFILISGYFSCESERFNIGRLLALIIQTSMFSLCVRIVSCLLNGTISIKSLVGSIFPANYYVILYCALMCFVPFVNRMMKTLKAKQLHLFVLISFLLLSVYPTSVDVFEDIVGREFAGLNSISINGSIGGYTIVNFILVYIIGAYIRKFDLSQKLTGTKIIAVLAISIVGIWVWRQLLPDTAFMYCNPVIIAEAVVVFILFLKIRVESNFVNMIAPALFTCFLIHSSVLSFIGINRFEGKSIFVVLSGLILVVLGIYVVSFIIMGIWNLITKPIFNKTIYRIPVINLEK